jgi:putative zinc finger/helix-turn-helix YgiT family protein
MRANKPNESMDSQTCPLCGKGKICLIQTLHHVDADDENSFDIPDVWVEKCDECNETFFPPESSSYIEQCIAEKTEQLTPPQLEQIRKRLGVDQTEMSEILGLGGRTFHRWEKGTQYPNRSMCYYIRVLEHSPFVFEWLRNRGWRTRMNTDSTCSNLSTMAKSFPDLPRTRFHDVTLQKNFNPTRGLTAVAFR